MGNNNELRIGKLQEEKFFSLIVNKYDDTIELPLDDANFANRFIDLLHWISEFEKESVDKEERIKEKYSGRDVMKYDADGVPEFDFEYLDELSAFHVGIYNAMFERIEMVFGKDSLKKYFRVFYENTPDFIPDEDALADFLEEIAPVISNLYDTKVEYRRKRKVRFDKYQKVYHK